jgi:hypothetical protein
MMNHSQAALSWYPDTEMWLCVAAVLCACAPLQLPLGSESDAENEAPLTTPQPLRPTAAPPQPTAATDSCDGGDSGDDSADMAGGVAAALLASALTDSVEVMVGVAGGPGALPACSPSSSPPRHASPPLRPQQHQPPQPPPTATTSIPAGSEKLQTASAAGEVAEAGAAAHSRALPQSRVLRRTESTDSDGSDGFGTSHVTITEEDLG